MAYHPHFEIGGAVVVMAFNGPDRRYKIGEHLSLEDMKRMANVDRLVHAGYLEPHPVPNAGPHGERPQRRMIHMGSGRYIVVVGHVLTREPVSKEEAEALLLG